MKLPVLALVVFTLSPWGCKKSEDKPPAPDNTEAATRNPAPTQSAPPNEPVERVTPSKLSTENICEMTSTYIYAALAIDSVQEAVIASHPVPKTSRQYVKVSCVQCVGEDFSYGMCPVEYGWECQAATLGLDGLDAGGSLSPRDLRVLSVKPIKSSQPLVKRVDLLLEHLDDPARTAFGDRDAIRTIAQKIKESAATLEKVAIGKKWQSSGLNHALLQVGETDTVIAIGPNSVTYLDPETARFGQGSCAPPPKGKRPEGR